MQRYVDRIQPMATSRERRKQGVERVNDDELHDHRSLSATLIYMGSGVPPQSTYVTSRTQQIIPWFTVQGRVDPKAMLNVLRMLDQYITFLKPKDITHIIIRTYSDASHAKKTCYRPTSIVSG